MSSFYFRLKIATRFKGKIQTPDIIAVWEFKPGQARWGRSVKTLDDLRTVVWETNKSSSTLSICASFIYANRSVLHRDIDSFEIAVHDFRTNQGQPTVEPKMVARIRGANMTPGNTTTVDPNSIKMSGETKFRDLVEVPLTFNPYQDPLVFSLA